MESVETALVSRSSQRLLLQLDDAQKRSAKCESRPTQLWKTHDAMALKDGSRRSVYWPSEDVPSFDAKHFKPLSENRGSSKVAVNKDAKQWRIGGTYTGDWMNNLRHGFGIQVWSNGNKYEGQWSEGMRSGQGVYWLSKKKCSKNATSTHKNQISQSMSMSMSQTTKSVDVPGDSVMYGRGTRFGFNTKTESRFGRKKGVDPGMKKPRHKGNKKESLTKLYDGEWLRDLKHGIGTFFYAPNERYEGEWQCGVRYGQGKMVYTSGEVYSGEWANDKRAGYGLATYPNGNTYEGEWADDNKEGAGEFYYKEQGKVYVGEWANDIAQCGVFRDADHLYGDEDSDDNDEEDGGGVHGNKKKRGRLLPKLRLRNPEGVLLNEIARIRAERDAVRCPDDMALNGGILSDDMSSVFAEQSQQAELRTAFDVLADTSGYINAIDISRISSIREHSERDVLDALDLCGKEPDDHLNYNDVTQVLRLLADNPYKKDTACTTTVDQESETRMDGGT